jgi:hypothetical protein
MREGLAEQLLARVMAWEEEDVTRERPVLQALADYKYDEYEQFQPGRRFIESLARWLSQFDDIKKRHEAYRMFHERLIFVSRAEMQHLVVAVFSDVVRPALVARAANDLDIPKHLIRRIVTDPAYATRKRSCLFVALSDGARTDVLRRANPDDINNEQVVVDYQALELKKDGLLKDLREDLGKDMGPDVSNARFSTVVLLDDFSASGISYAREDGKGKVARVGDRLRHMGDLVDLDDLEVLVILFVATDKAIEHLEAAVSGLEESVGGTWSVRAIQRLGPDVAIHKGDDPELDALIQEIYDPAINDKHMKKGGTDGRYGFADCGLPVVLAHNTPNNSIALLWGPDTTKIRGLFPRVSRHREDA